MATSQKNTDQQGFDSTEEYDKTVENIHPFFKMFWRSEDYRQHKMRQNGMKPKENKRRACPQPEHPTEKLKRILFATYKPAKPTRAKNTFTPKKAFTLTPQKRKQSMKDFYQQRSKNQTERSR